MGQYSHYSYRQYDNKVFVVTEHYAPSRTHSFGVIWSRERCVAIDPGLGLFGDVRKFVEGLTGFEKAIYAVSTSGKPQEVGGIGAFDEAFVNGPDYELAKASMAYEKRLETLKLLTNDARVLAEASEENAVDNSSIDLIEFHDPRVLRAPHSFDHFHLGGIHMGGELLPGYTPGSMVLSVHGDDTINCMFCGRSLTPNCNYLHHVDRAGFEAYRNGLETLLKHADEYSRFPLKRDSTVYFFSAESWTPFFKDVPEKLLKGAEEILEGKTDGDIPATYEGKSLKLHLAGSATILYDPALL